MATQRKAQNLPADLRLEPWLPLFLVLLGVVVYANELPGPFVFDDINYIYNNPRAQEWTWQNLVSERPLLWYSLAANYQLGGFRPMGYKIFNLAVHLAAALTLYDLMRRTLLLPRFGDRFQKSAAGLGFAVAALWVVHPLTTESVSYIIHRGESMMGLFALLMMYGTLRGAQSQTEGIRWLWYAATIVACLLGFWSKPFMIAVPVVVLLYDRIMLGGSWQAWATQRGLLYLAMLLPVSWAFWINTGDARARLKTKEPVVAAAPQPAAASQPAAAPSPATATPAQAPSSEFDTGFPRRVSSLRYARTQFGVIAHYLRLAFVPYPLCADYFWRPADTMERILPPALLIGGLVLATCWALWRYPAWGFLGAAFFLLLGPSSSFIPIEDIATERRMYLPLAALIALLVFGVWEFLGYLERSNQAAAVQPVDSRSSFFGAVLLAVVLTVWGGLTILRNFDYSDDIDFCELMARQNPVNSRARVNLARGLILKAEREPLPAVRDAYYTEALKYLAEAEVSAPRSAFVQSQIGHILSQQREIERLLRRPGWQTRRASHLEEAERRFRKAVDLYPNYALFRLNLATVLEQKGTPAALDEALEQFQQAADIGRRTEHVIPESHYGLARMLRDHNRLRESVPQFEETLRLDSRQVKAQLDLASVLFQLSRVPNAIAAAEDALRKAEALGDAQDAEDARRLIQGFRTSQPTTQASKSATQGSK